VLYEGHDEDFTVGPAPASTPEAQQVLTEQLANGVVHGLSLSTRPRFTEVGQTLCARSRGSDGPLTHVDAPGP
jgi:hypothetical protein